MIKAILIDLDGVLRVWNPDNDAEAERITRLPAGALRRAAFAPDLLLPVITGRVPDEHWRRQVVARLRLTVPDADAEQAVRLWSASPGEVDQGVLEIVRRCRRQTRIVLITNATSRPTEDLWHLQLVEELDDVINSAEVGWVKPEAEIFHAALRTAGVSPEEAFFVDDNATNVDAAGRLGIAGHVFRGADQLERELTCIGLLPSWQ
jgi:putative hydrolase of the HAD superfamily